DVIATCSDSGQSARIDLVVATHRHRDHVGGFADAAWSRVDVGEVWMPWTEDPKDPRAARIRNRQSAFALALAGTSSDEEPLAVPASPAERPAQAARRAVRAMVINALTNEAAMATLHRGFAGSPRRIFLPVEGANCEVRSVAGVEGVTIHVLGPP